MVRRLHDKEMEIANVQNELARVQVRQQQHSRPATRPGWGRQHARTAHGLSISGCGWVGVPPRQVDKLDTDAHVSQLRTTLTQLDQDLKASQPPTHHRPQACRRQAGR